MEKTLLFKFLLIANALGAAYGFIFFYGGQLLSTNPLLWIFVPDCPLYAFVFAISLLMLNEKIRADWFYFLVFVGAVKYGFWTMFVLSNYSYYYFSADFWTSFMCLVLFVSHLVLFLEPAIMLGRVRVRPTYLGIAVFWFLLNDFADYGLGPLSTHPPIPLEKMHEIFTITVLMTVVFALGCYLLVKKYQPKK